MNTRLLSIAAALAITAGLACGLAFGFDADTMLMTATAAAVPLDELSAEIKRIVSEFGKKSKELGDAVEKSDHDIKNYGKVAEETKGLIESLSKKQVEAEAEMDSRLKEVEQMAADFKTKANAPKVRTIGDVVLEHKDKILALAERRSAGSVQIEVKDITSATASAGPGIWSYRDPEIVAEPYRPISIRNLIPTIPVGSNLVEWVAEKVRTNNASAVSEGAAKPKSDITYERKETAVRKIAHYFKTSMEVLQDFPRLRAELNSTGFEMLRQEEESQLMSGDGTGDNLLGLIPQATAFDNSVVIGSDQQVDVLRRAMLQVRQSYYSATGIVLNPQDWAEIELLKDSENRYLFSAATNGAPRRLWGLPVSEADSLPAGEFMVGAFRTAATIYDRMAAAVFISSENEDDFIKNMVSILFEERLALCVKRSLAFVHGNLDGST